jgi:hypothetical protein
MNHFNIDYTKKTLDLQFEGEKFSFDLNEGDVGDFWHSFTTKEGIVKDINFYQEDENEVPLVSVYGVKDNGKGELLIDTNDCISVESFEKVGDPEIYFS